MAKSEAFWIRRFLLSLVGLLFLLASCTPAQISTDEILVALTVDGEERQINAPLGSLAKEVLNLAGVNLGLLDRTEPNLLALLSEGDMLRVVRVAEEFETEQERLPFDRRILRNESLPQGEQRLIQPGKNGLAEITFRLVFEDNKLTSRTRVNSIILEKATDEIIMLGVQAPSTSLTITGQLAFLSAGNAWLIEENTGIRRLLVASGDLDGRIFSLSPDGNWLLFSREDNGEGSINDLWVVSLDKSSDVEIDLGVANVVHFADWVPNEDSRVVYSSVNYSSNPPGWQANNDLQFVDINPNETTSNALALLSSRSNSLYSWWGTDFAWSQDGEQLAYASPESVGLVDLDNDESNILLELLIYQTESDWAWLPGISWAPDSSMLFTVSHVEQPGLDNQERSPFFDIVAIDREQESSIRIADKAGMFANPVASPLLNTDTGDADFKLAYLQALNPAQSDVSTYQLVVSNADGGNSQVIFPTLGTPGLIPQKIVWSPKPTDANSSLSIAVIYQSNLWIVDVANGRAQQITGDGLVTRISWGQ